MLWKNWNFQNMHWLNWLIWIDPSHISPLKSNSGTSVSRDISTVGIPHVNNSPAIDSKRAVNSSLCTAAVALWSVLELAKLKMADVANFTAVLWILWQTHPYNTKLLLGHRKWKAKPQLIQSSTSQHCSF